MTSTSISIASGRRRLSSGRRYGTSSSASARAAADAIKIDKDRRRRRNRGDDDQADEQPGSIDEFAANVAATAESLGLPRWTLRAVVLGLVGLLLATVVVGTLPLLARHEVSGIATFDDKPLGRVPLSFHRLETAGGTVTAAADGQTIRTEPDGSFRIEGSARLRPGLYAVAVLPGEVAPTLPRAYRGAETTPFRIEVREDLSGVQLSIQGADAPTRKAKKRR